MMDGLTLTLENESALVERAQASPAAFAPIYDHYFPRIFTYVRYRVPDAPTADDLTAHIFEKALVNMAAYRPERAPFGAWLFGIARNAVNDYLRAQRRRPWLSFDWLTQHPSPDPLPETVAIRATTHQHLLNTVARLTERERDLIALKFSGGLTNRRMAELMGMSESHVGVSLYRALQKLRAMLKDEE